MVQGLLAHAYTEMALDQNDRYVSYVRMAQKVYENYDQKQKSPGNGPNVRTPLPPLPALSRAVLAQLLDPRPDAPKALPYAARAIIRTQLGMGPETNAPAVLSTNLPAELSPNAPPPAATNTPAGRAGQ
jgi:hypothetical protein